MMPPQLVDVNGQPITLDRQIGSGGEGMVFTLSNDSTRVAKVYHRPPTPQTVEKLNAMVCLGRANPQLLALATWPMGLLYQAGNRQPAGFVMPRLSSDCQPIQHLYNPVQRLRFFPRAGWNFQVRAAINLAAAFDEVHKVGCLVGDVNQSNVQVSTQALVRLIDCDSFQVRLNGKAYPCEVGVAHYIPPELQGKSLRGLVRTENHDRFGLAVLIYQLLFVGRHPYAGVYRGAGDPSFEQLIAEFRFAQGPNAHRWDMAPPPHTPTFVDIPPKLGNLFRRAFERGSEKNDSRPKPAEWLDALKCLEASIVECTADPGHKYWRGAQSCTWCRLADHRGPEYYFGVAGDAGTFAVDEAKLQDVLRRLNTCGPFDFPYDRRRFMPSPLPEPDPLPDGLEEHRSTKIILGVAIGLCALSLPFGLLHKAVCISGFLGTLVFGAWLAIHVLLSPWHREYSRRRTVLNNARYDLEKIENEWRQTVSRYRRAHDDSRQSIERLIAQYRGLTTQYQVEMQRLTANAEEMARIRHLRLHQIADADIPQIGVQRKQLLASNGILTAADIDESRIRGIKGFGDVLTCNLLGWKNKVLQEFQFDRKTAVSPGERRAITVKFRNEQQRIFAELNRQIENLESLAPKCRDTLQRLALELKPAVAEYIQAEMDLKLLESSGFSLVRWLIR